MSSSTKRKHSAGYSSDGKRSRRAGSTEKHRSKSSHHHDTKDKRQEDNDRIHEDQQKIHEDPVPTIHIEKLLKLIGAIEPIQSSLGPKHTLRHMLNRMDYLIGYIESRSAAHNNNTNNSEFTDTILKFYSKCFTRSLTEVYEEENFTLCNETINKNSDNFYDAKKRAENKLHELTEKPRKLKDLHMRKAPVNDLGFLSNPEDKLAVEGVVLKYMKSPMWWINRRSEILHSYDIVDSNVAYMVTQYEVHTLSIVMAYELALLLQVFLWPYTYLSLTGWPNCEIYNSKCENVKYLETAVGFLNLTFRSLPPIVDKVKGGLKTNQAVCRMTMHYITATKVCRIKLGLLGGFFVPTPNTVNRSIRSMATAQLMKEHEQGFSQAGNSSESKKRKYKPTDDEDRKNFITQSEKNNLSEILGYHEVALDLYNFLGERKDQIELFQQLHKSQTGTK